jgi:hypothetical protein
MKRVLIALVTVVAAGGAVYVVLKRDYEQEPTFHSYRWHLYGTVVDSNSNLLDRVTVTISAFGPRGQLDRLREKSSAAERVMRKQTDRTGYFDFDFEATGCAVIVDKEGYEEKWLKFGRYADRQDNLDQRLTIVLERIGPKVQSQSMGSVIDYWQLHQVWVGVGMARRLRVQYAGGGVIT